MSKPIRAAFERARAEHRSAFVAYQMAGYPDIETSIALARAVADAGADVLELGIPFSDPLADGASVQHAGQHALEQGMTLASCFEVAASVAEHSDIPIVLMGYYNPFLRMGLAEACQRAATAGVSGLIIPDLPAEESEPLIAAARPHGISLTFLVTPTSPEARIAKVAQISQEAESGFVYVVSLSGVTGARSSLSETLPSLVEGVRRHTGDLPLAIGFGISRPEHVATVAKLADGFAVGSALINAYDAAPAGEGVAAVATLARELRAGAARD